MLRAIDTHAHLDFPAFDADRDQLVAELEKERIGVINIATSVESNNHVDKLTKKHRYIWGALGIHPTDITPEIVLNLPSILDHFSQLLAANNKLIALGEIGLDYHHQTNSQGAERQKVVLRELLTFAQEKNLPIIVHCRKAYGDMATILSDYPGVRGAIHCFSGSITDAEAFLKIGYSISLAGMLTYPANEDLRQASLTIPLDRLLLETDSPFLAPQSARGERNDPRAILEIADVHARLRGVERDVILSQTLENAENLFGIETD